MSRSNSKTWEDFMNSEFAKSELTKMSKEAQVIDRNKLYNVDPKNYTELNKSVETMGVAPGGASLVGGGDSKALYTTKSVKTPGGAEEYADTTVEGLEDIQSAMMEVAMREATGGPFGTQDNAPEKWDGLQAAGKSVKPFTKKAQDLDPEKVKGFMEGFSGAKLMDDDSEEDSHETSSDADSDIEAILAELDKEQPKEDHLAAASRKATIVAHLKELVKIANDLDLEGNHQDASEIDAVLKDEIKALASRK